MNSTRVFGTRGLGLNPSRTANRDVNKKIIKNYDFSLIDKSIKFIDILCCSRFYNLKINGFYKLNKKSYLSIYNELLIYIQKKTLFLKKLNMLTKIF